MTPPDPSRRVELVAAIVLELARAYKKHGTEPWSRHEFLGILREEYLELEAAIFTDAPSDRLLAELVQVAAMCFRFLETGDRQRGVLPRLGWNRPLGAVGDRYFAAPADPAKPENGYLVCRVDGLELDGLRVRSAVPGVASHSAALMSPMLAGAIAALLSLEEVAA